ncbi:hypothetical protein LTR70_010233 [Exophiala xenobiotica]|uniref:Vitellogenin n=1 Tax=Lithohypha guttulata TaxID=1690604 RepID=A0ABR0JUW1_9EURO|nr:hypothetical protein LTR24_010241 [Lithohypha guttulata]KAK5309501.1 hypothetical protein LTR70_010233 [Exophiala xenobiotica]
MIDTQSSLPIPLLAWVVSSGCGHIAQVNTVDVKQFSFDLIATTKHISETLTNESEYANLGYLGKMARESFRRGEWVPEFATYNIFRAYSLRFSISLSFAGKTLSFRQDNIPVEVVAGMTQPLGEGQNVCTNTFSAGSQVTMVDMLSTELDDQLLLLTEQAGQGVPPPSYRPRDDIAG